MSVQSEVRGELRRFALGLLILLAILAVPAISALIGVYFFGDVGVVLLVAPILLAVLLHIAWTIGESL